MVWFANRFVVKPDTQCTYSIKPKGVLATVVAVGKQGILRILSVCLLHYLSSMQCACAILSSVACPALKYFPILSHKRRDFREKVIEHKMCVFIFSASVYEAFLIIIRNELSIIISYIHLLVKHPLVLSDFNET